MPLIIFLILVFVVFAKLGITGDHVSLFFKVISIAILCIVAISLILFAWGKFYLEPRLIAEAERQRIAEREAPPQPGETLEGRLRKRFERSLSAEIRKIALKRFFNTPPTGPSWQDMLAGTVHRDLWKHISVDEYALALKMLEDIKNDAENELTFPLFPVRNAISDSISGEHIKKQLDSGSIVSGQQFEIWCKSALEHKGWKVEETAGSGDQGVDLIGWYSGVKVVFQCKHYSKTVGNSAVQEVIAGKIFYGAGVGVVVTSGAGFSPSAVRLADAAGIILLSGKEIFSIGSRIDF